MYSKEDSVGDVSQVRWTLLTGCSKTQADQSDGHHHPIEHGCQHQGRIPAVDLKLLLLLLLRLHTRDMAEESPKEWPPGVGRGGEAPPPPPPAPPRPAP